MDPRSTPSSSLLTETLPDATPHAAAGGGSGGGGVSSALNGGGGAGVPRAPVGVVGAALEVLEVEQVGVNDDNGDALGNDNGDDDNASENAEDYDKAADVSRAMLERTRYRFFFFFSSFPFFIGVAFHATRSPQNKKTNTKTILCTTTNPSTTTKKKTARH